MYLCTWRCFRNAGRSGIARCCWRTANRTTRVSYTAHVAHATHATYATNSPGAHDHPLISSASFLLILSRDERTHPNKLRKMLYMYYLVDILVIAHLVIVDKANMTDARVCFANRCDA